MAGIGMEGLKDGRGWGGGAKRWQGLRWRG